ncbi:hypothetical protein RHMOL_Rhmol03G0150000 [Rhododendron molle]|uniref:Uncharacterized protein n=1 Tax=Rhododendron molle TaxID=49168 RepID=A0ACC0PE51_RHOML|nr:hypothetical protein RHMOL_Rhmol03G0150000 [Rhododendron molle]
MGEGEESPDSTKEPMSTIGNGEQELSSSSTPEKSMRPWQTVIRKKKQLSERNFLCQFHLLILLALVSRTYVASAGKLSLGLSSSGMGCLGSGSVAQTVDSSAGLFSGSARNVATDGVIAQVPEIILRCISRDEAALAVAQKKISTNIGEASTTIDKLNVVINSYGESLAEKGGLGLEKIMAHPDFMILAAMNPGGDYGKNELSPALRNRFTEIWVSPANDLNELRTIELRNRADLVLLILWKIFVFIDATEGNLPFEDVLLHGAFLVLLDGISLDNNNELVVFITSGVCLSIPFLFAYFFFCNPFQVGLTRTVGPWAIPSKGSRGFWKSSEPRACVGRMSPCQELKAVAYDVMDMCHATFGLEGKYKS